MFYNPNGSGRDSYIHVNHGGFAIAKVRNVQPEVGKMNWKEVHIKTNSPIIHSKPVHYSTNGTGRDTYISSSSGGMHLESSPGSRKTFFNSLRSYDSRNQSYSPARSPAKRGSFMRSQSYFNTSQNSGFSKIRVHQKMLDTRLSKPKRLSMKSSFFDKVETKKST